MTSITRPISSAACARHAFDRIPVGNQHRYAVQQAALAVLAVGVLLGACDSAFKKSSVQAAVKFKYKPRVIDGQNVEGPGVRNKFTYKIED